MHKKGESHHDTLITSFHFQCGGVLSDCIQACLCLFLLTSSEFMAERNKMFLKGTCIVHLFFIEFKNLVQAFECFMSPIYKKNDCINI